MLDDTVRENLATYFDGIIDNLNTYEADIIASVKNEVMKILDTPVEKANDDFDIWNNIYRNKHEKK